MKSILVVGSVALDSVQTPEGASNEALGGSAVYFSLAAKHFAQVRMVGVVGEDFPKEHRAMLETHDIDTVGLTEVAGKTFRWEGKFDEKFDVAQTLATHLNVFETFRPELNDDQKGASVLFLANIDPELQMDVLSQMKGPKIVAADTMNFWIDSKLPALKELLSRVDILFVNEEEAKQLAGDSNNVRAAKKLAKSGPSVVIIKKGEHGALLYAGGGVYPIPAFPTDEVKDPTGAGDSFAGGFMGCLCTSMDLKDVTSLKRAMSYGAAMASWNVQGFSTCKLEELTREQLDERQRAYVEMLSIEGQPAGV